MERSGDGAIATIIAVAGLLVAVAAGSWWVADAVIDGSASAVLLRFGATVAIGAYYLLMYRIAKGRTETGAAARSRSRSDV